MARTMNVFTPVGKGKGVGSRAPTGKGKGVGSRAPVKKGGKKPTKNANLYDRINLEGTGSPSAKSGCYMILSKYRSPEGKFSLAPRRTARTLAATQNQGQKPNKVERKLVEDEDGSYATQNQGQKPNKVERKLFEDEDGSYAKQVNSDINNGK